MSVEFSGEMNIFSAIADQRYLYDIGNNTKGQISSNDDFSGLTVHNRMNFFLFKSRRFPLHFMSVKVSGEMNSFLAIADQRYLFAIGNNSKCQIY